MKKLAIVLVGLMISVTCLAQGNRADIEERYRSQKIAFITDKMQLTPEESKAFWPLYTQYETEKSALVHEMHSYRATFPADEADMTDEQAVELLAFFNKHQADMFKLSQEYQKKYLKVISAKKLLLLNDAENGFRKYLLQEFRGRGGRGGTRLQN